MALLASAVVLAAAAPASDPGYAVVVRQSSTCVLCHAGPFPNPHLQGSIGPDLHGVGARLTEPEIRERLVDASKLNPDTVMPSFGILPEGARVGAAWRGKPILSPQEIDAAASYLATLK